MQAMWVCLKENISCVSKPNDVVERLEKGGKKIWKCTAPKQSLGTAQLVHYMGNSFGQRTARQNSRRAQFYEVSIGNPSRNIIEMIFQRASLNPSKPSRKISKVLKVKNSAQSLERFERYREKVKKKAYEQCQKHPRSVVDGNELLRFYGTTMTCCREKSKQVNELCKDPACGACRMIQCNFDTDYTKKSGIRLSTSSEALNDNMITKLKNMKRAVIVCRIIAGSVANIVNELHEECDSLGSEGPNCSHLIVRNPCAVLPCFVIIFN